MLLYAWLSCTSIIDLLFVSFCFEGGGIFIYKGNHGSIRNCLMNNQENGIDFYEVQHFEVIGNNCSDNSGWGIHLWKSQHNLIMHNVADRCTRNGPNVYYTCDTAGLLMNCDCSYNKVLYNSFTYGGDGVFMSGYPRDNKNECCPSNYNLLQGNDCSHSPNNAFESTFAIGNKFLNNKASYSHYGFWLGYSHTGNEVKGNEINFNEFGVAIDHGQSNEISSNTFVGNKQLGIQLWSDETQPYLANSCLQLKTPTSEGYTIHSNIFRSSGVAAVSYVNTTKSLFYNNLLDCSNKNVVVESYSKKIGGNNQWNLALPIPGPNIVFGPFIGGNMWCGYDGAEKGNTGFGGTSLPFNNQGQIPTGGDYYPLVDPGKKEEAGKKEAAFKHAAQRRQKK